MNVAKSYMLTSDLIRHDASWPLRYLILVWLSLICMLPFDLERFDEKSHGETASILEKIGREELDKPGLEREGAALMLSKLYMRLVPSLKNGTKNCQTV